MIYQQSIAMKLLYQLITFNKMTSYNTPLKRTTQVTQMSI